MADGKTMQNMHGNGDHGISFQRAFKRIGGYCKGNLMCLIHDIVEIDAGDTYAYDTEGLKTQKAREDAAKERIFSILPEIRNKS